MHGKIQRTEELVAVRNISRSHALEGLQVAGIGLEELKRLGIVIHNGHRRRLAHIDEAGFIQEDGFWEGFEGQVPVTAVGPAFCSRQGPAEIIALEFFTADIPEKLSLFPGLHPFCQGVDSQFFGHPDNGRKDGTAFFGERMEKGHVQFQGMEVVILQHVQGRIAAAKIVQPDFETGFPEPAQTLADGIILQDQGVFRHFRVKEIPGQLVSGQGIFQQPDRIHQLEIQTGEIDGNGQDRLALLQLAVEPSGHLFHHIPVQTVDQPGFFQGGMNRAGKGDRIPGNPSGPGLRSCRPCRSENGQWAGSTP